MPIRTRIVSFLGLGSKPTPPHYTPVSYRWEAERSEPSAPTPLVQAALRELLPGSSTFLLGTKKVEDRWLGGASSLLDTYLSTERRQFKRVPSGEGPGDLWKIFETFQKALSPDPISKLGEDAPPNRLVVDITHGFRIQPILGLAAVSFVQSDWARRQLPSPPTVQIVYGAFEARVGEGDAAVAPVWDLTDFLTVARWNASFDAFLRYGRADDLDALAAADAKRATALARAQGKRGAELGVSSHVGRLGKAFKTLADDLATARTHAILTASAPSLLRLLDDPKTQTLLERLPVLRSAVTELRDRITPLISPTLMSQEGLQAVSALAQLYVRLQRFSEGIATVREGLVTAYGLRTTDVPLPEPTERQRANKAFDAHRKEVDRALGDAARAGSTGDAAAQDDPAPDIVKLFEAVGQARNDLQHAGYRSGYSTAGKLIKNLKGHAQAFHDLVTPSAPAVSPASPALFLNLTNHPVAQWSPAQREAAQSLGHGAPTDLQEPLPLVPPDATSEEVEDLADELVDAAQAQVAQAGATLAGAAVQGEPTLTFALVARLQAMGVPCYAATTHRDVRDVSPPEGSPSDTTRTEHVFRFVAWRAYPPVV